MSRRRIPPVVLATSALAFAALPAQDLNLTVVGGSLPGVTTFDASGLYLFELVVIIPSSTPGPTPCWLFDPNDSRTLTIGFDLFDLMAVGFGGFDGHFAASYAVPANPSFIDQAAWAQAMTFAWAPTLFDRISNPTAVHFGPAGSFRNRSVSFSSPRAFATALARPDESWMLVGGANGQLLAQTATATTEIYNPVTDSFSPGPTMTAPRSMHTMTLLADGRWLLAGGVDAANDPQPGCEVYDPATDTFTPVAPMNSPRMGHTATLLPDGRVFVTGGLEAMTVTPLQAYAIRDATPTTEIYDPVADTWTPTPNMSKPRAAHASILRPDGKVLLCGGISWDPGGILGFTPTVRNTCDLYDPVANTMVPGPAMAVARSLTDALDLGNGKWLLAGGINNIVVTLIPFNISLGSPIASAEVYDALANTWTTVGSMATARGYQRAWPLGGGQFLLAGGAGGTLLAPTPIGTTEVFTLATGQFSPGPSLTSPRAAAAMLRTPHGQVQLFGGSTAGASISNTTEWYFF